MKYALTISKIPAGSSEVIWPLDESLFEAIGHNYEIERLQGKLHLHLQRDERFLRVEINIEGEVTLPCDRCLQPITFDIGTKHQHVYALTPTYPHPEPTEEFYELSPRQDRIDLTQAIYDYVCLAVPVKRVRPTCPDEYCPPYVQNFIQPEPPHT